MAEVKKKIVDEKEAKRLRKREKKKSNMAGGNRK